MPDPNCTRCGGTGSFETVGDLHKSGGIVPCYCETPKPTKPSEPAVVTAARKLADNTKIRPFPVGRPKQAHWLLELLESERTSPRDGSRICKVRARAREVGEIAAELKNGPVSTEKMRRLGELLIQEI